MTDSVKKRGSILKNLSYVLIGNVISLVISAMLTFLIPKKFSHEVYSYFQLENLYCGYVWLMSLGWIDGIYLKYGGEKRQDICKADISGQFVWMIVYLTVTGGILLGVSGMLFSTDEKKIIFIFAVCSVVIENLTTFVTNLLQATNSMIQYAKITIADRILYFCFVILLITRGVSEFYILIGVDILSKCITLMLAVYTGRDMLFVLPKGIRQTYLLTKELISTGICISMASYASRLITSIVRFMIEQRWGLVTFGKISLALTISNMFSKFVAAVSTVLFPVLRRIQDSKLTDIYKILRTVLMFTMLLLFLFYLPVKKVLLMFLPEYQESLYYLAIMLPICLYETKVTMLINTYLKTIRKERIILYCNAAAVLTSVIISLIFVYGFQNLELTVFGIVVSLAFRCIAEEWILSKYLEIYIWKDTFLEIMMSLIFITSSWKVDGMEGSLLYGAAFLLYCWIKRKDLLEIWNRGKIIMKDVK